MVTAPPYFYVGVKAGTENEVESALRRRFADQIREVSQVRDRQGGEIRVCMGWQRLHVR